MRVLVPLGRLGLLWNDQEELIDAEIDAILANAPDVEASPLFEERARAAMARALANRTRPPE
jgi:hypothetical protein